MNPITHHNSPKSYLVRRQQAVHRSQLSFQLGNLTVQATNRRENCVLLLPILQENVIAPQIQHISLQMLDASLEVRLLVLKPRPLKQRFLVLQLLTPPEPPVINKKDQQLTKYETAERIPIIYQRKSNYITQKTYHRRPPTRRTNSKIKKMKRKPDTPHHFNRTAPTTTGPEKRKTCTVPPSTPG
jgi:hypothetical protein